MRRVVVAAAGLLLALTPVVHKGSMFTVHGWFSGWYVGDFWGGPQNVQHPRAAVW